MGDLRLNTSGLPLCIVTTSSHSSFHFFFFLLSKLFKADEAEQDDFLRMLAPHWGNIKIQEFFTPTFPRLRMTYSVTYRNGEYLLVGIKAGKTTTGCCRMWVTRQVM